MSQNSLPNKLRENAACSYAFVLMEFCRLDNLPVELVHYLLNYFSAHEIFYTFTNVSSYIDAVLVAYSNYKINFKSISRSNFNLICETIKPDQVMSLTLSDDEHTPGLVELFLSRFQINQFTHLQSLKLIDVGLRHWENIMTTLIELKNIRSFLYITSSQNSPWYSDTYGDDATQLDIRLFGSYAPILPQLQRLRLNHADFLTSVQFPHLHHLQLGRCSDDIFKHICSVAPNLKYLNTSLTHDDLSIKMIYPLPKLTRLVLQVDGSTISMNNIEEMMSCLPCLRHLELVAECHNDVVDGQRWQMKVKSLLTFRIKLSLLDGFGEENLDSFRSLFWVEEKQWFVAYRRGYLFSVPYFNERECDTGLMVPVYSTAPDNKIFHESIKKFKISRTLAGVYDQFTHVETLNISNPIRLSNIERMVNLRHVQHLILDLPMTKFPVMGLINLMPSLHHISIKDNVNLFLNQARHSKFEKIRALSIGNPFTSTGNYDIEKLCNTFPNIKHLHIDYACSVIEVFYFVDRFKHLSTASFRLVSWLFRGDVPQRPRHQIQSILEGVRRRQRLNFTFRLTSSSVYLWL